MSYLFESKMRCLFFSTLRGRCGEGEAIHLAFEYKVGGADVCCVCDSSHDVALEREKGASSGRRRGGGGGGDRQQGVNC